MAAKAGRIRGQFLRYYRSIALTEQTMTMERRRIGELDCVVLDAPGCEESVAALAIFCHGFGAPGEDLVPCGPELHSSAPGGLPRVRFVFPAAPVQLGMGGMFDSRAWWPIDMLKLQQIMATGQVRDLQRDQPAMLPQRNRQLTDVLDQLMEESGVDYAQVILGGFSQGAMLTTDVALSLPESVGGVVVWSGTLLNEQNWAPAVKARSGMPVVQSHGRVDPILPFAGAELLRDLFVENGLKVEFIDFVGQHTIPREAIATTAALITRVARGG
jgi:phospholipase/carboxylesterase